MRAPSDLTVSVFVAICSLVCFSGTINPNASGNGVVICLVLGIINLVFSLMFLDRWAKSLERPHYITPERVDHDSNLVPKELRDF